MDKVYLIGALYKRLKELGLPTGKMWMLREERKGHLKFRRDAAGKRRVSEKEIEEIIKVYYPGGKGHWNYDGSMGSQDAPRKAK